MNDKFKFLEFPVNTDPDFPGMLVDITSIEFMQVVKHSENIFNLHIRLKNGTDIHSKNFTREDMKKYYSAMKKRLFNYYMYLNFMDVSGE